LRNNDSNDLARLFYDGLVFNNKDRCIGGSIRSIENKKDYGYNINFKIEENELKLLETTGNNDGQKINFGFFINQETRFLAINCYATVCFEMRNELILENETLDPRNSKKLYSNNPHIIKRYMRMVKSIAELSNLSENNLNIYTFSIVEFLSRDYHKLIRLEAAHNLLKHKV
jgi:hypothetical protein